MNKKIVNNSGYIRVNEGYEKRGGINTNIKTPRPADPKPQTSSNNQQKK